MSEDPLNSVYCHCFFTVPGLIPGTVFLLDLNIMFRTGRE